MGSDTVDSRLSRRSMITFKGFWFCDAVYFWDMKLVGFDDRSPAVKTSLSLSISCIKSFFRSCFISRGYI